MGIDPDSIEVILRRFIREESRAVAREEIDAALARIRRCSEEGGSAPIRALPTAEAAR